MDESLIKCAVDARGLACPMPLLKAKQGLAKIEKGELLQVVATDSGSVRDFNAFIDLTDHELIEFKDTEGVFVYLIKKG